MSGNEERVPATDSTAVIGAGMAGLVCARRLFAAGQKVTVLEQSRDLGGRLATHRVGKLSFDHGAQYVVARDPQLQDYLELAKTTGFAEFWAPSGADLPRSEQWVVGVPSMNALLRPLAAGLNVRRGLKVVSCRRRAEEWWLTSTSGDELGPFGTLVLAIPAPQAIELLSELTDDAFDSRLHQVRMAPCWAVMAGFPQRIGVSVDVLSGESGTLAWAARDGSKPGRKSPHECWVLHATPQWSRQHLDLPRKEVAQSLLSEFELLLGPMSHGVWLAAHLWRYARVEQSLGEPCLWNPVLQLGLCGDWCLDARAEAAWLSGTTLAGKMLGVSRDA